MSRQVSTLRVGLVQCNSVVGDLEGNLDRLARGIEDAAGRGAQLVLTPELGLTGYPPEDLLLKEHFLADAADALEALAGRTRDVVALVGFPERRQDVANALAVLADGRVQAVYRKVWLPNYGVFDEERYFAAGEGPALLEIGDALVGLTICEDIWEPGPPASAEALAGATLIVNASASPYHRGKGAQRERMIAQRARDSVVALAFCNLVGGQDELVFDGDSLVVDHEGRVLARGAQFAEEVLVCDVDLATAANARLRDARHRPLTRAHAAEVPVLASVPLPGDPAAARPEAHAPGPDAPEAGEEEAGPAVPYPPPRLGPDEEVYAALVLGTRDYVEKNGFGRVVLGLSGGIDSALVAVIAVDALGPDRVALVVMPSPYSSADTQEDARRMARGLGVEPLELPIEPAMRAYEAMLEAAFAGREPDITEENLQARIRGNLLMALSNKLGHLVLTTGNKSEMSVGYSTLYGDLAGGFAVIKDVPKTLVYRLAELRNARGPEPVIPPSILERAPSAELRPDQRDVDSLPPYEVLDAILEGAIEHDLGREQLVARGMPGDDVDRALALVDRNEYKRRQAPPGVRISTRAFGRDRRMPITNRYRG